MIKQSFTLRVLVISFLVLALPLLIDSFIFFQDAYYEAVDDAKLDLRQAANLRAFTLKEMQPARQALLSELTYLLDLSAGFSEKELAKLSEELEAVSHASGYLHILVLDIGPKDHYRIVASSLQALVDTPFTSFIKVERIIEKGEGSFIRYIFSPEERRYIPYLFVAQVISSNVSGEPIGIIMITADIEEQLDSVLATAENQNLRFAVVNSDGITFASTDPNLTGKYFDPISPQRRQEILLSNQMGTNRLALKPVPVIRGDDPPFFEFIFDDQVQIAYRAYISDFGISILAYSPKQEFFGKAVRHFLFIYTLYGFILVGGGGVTYWLSTLISRPLRQLSHRMGEVSQGNFDVRFEKEPLGFEINILGGIFNDTLNTLLQNIQKAENERVKKETYQREIAIGRTVQRNLLPSKHPKLDGIEVFGTYLAAQEVGGDYYGYLRRPSQTGEEILFISVADAAGKGISPCLYSLSARSILHSFASFLDDPGEALCQTNNAFLEDTGETGMFVTMFASTYHTESKKLTYYSCGHVPPIVRRADGQLEHLEHSGMALGLQASKGYQSDSIQLQRGDLVLFYTKGVIEATNEKKQFFSEKRLRECLQQRRWLTAKEVVDGLTEELQTFMGGAAQEDEVIMVALKVE